MEHLVIALLARDAKVHPASVNGEGHEWRWKPTRSTQQKRFAGSSGASEVGLRWRVRSVNGSRRGAVASSCVSTVGGESVASLLLLRIGRRRLID